MDGFLSVEPKDLERLSAEEAVEFFRKLLCAEAAAIGLTTSSINIPLAIDIPDGGIDAEVKEVEASNGQGVIKSGLTCYQIKTGSFSLGNNATDVKSIIFNDSGELKPRVKSCLDKNGTLIVVLFGSDLPDSREDDQVKKKFAEILATKDKKYAKAAIEIWRQNQLISFLEPYPALRLHLLGRGELPFYDHYSWSKMDDMTWELQLGEAQEDYIKNLRTELIKNDKPLHIRQIGEPGVGKTRLTLVALEDDFLAPLTLYCPTPKDVLGSSLINHLSRQGNTFQAILVIDECDATARADIWNKIKSVSPRVKLITIYNEPDESVGTMVRMDTPLLNDEQIGKIIGSYGFPQDQTRRWVQYCSGSPRVAHIIGRNLKLSPDNLLAEPDTVQVWDRYIADTDSLNSPRFEARKKVLLWLSLFKKFGYGVPLQEEANLIYKKIAQEESGNGYRDFQRIINDLRKRKILQGETTLYITPKLLHIKLWSEWWNLYGTASEFKIDDFIVIDPTTNPPTVLNRRMIDWFFDMFKYARESEAASRVVKELLGSNGPFQDPDFLNSELGSRFFLNLTEANPSAALDCLNRVIGNWDKDQLLKFEAGRRNVVWALEKIGIWGELFSGAARLLLKLGEAENETWSNNASGVFADFFSAGYGQVATTELAPKDRLPILKEAIESSLDKVQLLAVEAIDKALETSHFTRMVGAEEQGLRKEPNLWKPATYGEIWEGYRLVWQLITSKLEGLTPEAQQKAVTTILHRSRGLIRIRALSNMVLDTLRQLAKKPYVGTEKVLPEIVTILRYERKELPDELKTTLISFRDELTGSDYHSLLKRYVGMDLLEDHFNDEGEHADQVQDKIIALAQESVKDRIKLQNELDWLCTTQPQNGFRFGYELGKLDTKFSFLPDLLKAQKRPRENPSVYFLGGYFKAIYENDPVRWESTLEEIARDESLMIWLPELTWRSGMSDTAAMRILRLAESGKITAVHFRVFGLGSVIADLSEDVVNQWLNYLSESDDPLAISIALDLHHFYYVQKKKPRLPEQLTLDLLTHRNLITPRERQYQSQMEDHEWSEIAKAFIEQYPERQINLIEVVLEHFGEDDTLFDDITYSSIQSVINTIFHSHPTEVWDKIKPLLDPPYNSRAFHITHWLRGNKFFEAEPDPGTISYVPMEKLWEWVDEKIDERAWYLATFVPPALFHDNDKTCLARELLIKYGDRDDVRRNLNANFSTEGWSGEASLHYQGKKERMVALREVEDNPNVQRWLDDYISGLDQAIERAKIEEERDLF